MRPKTLITVIVLIVSVLVIFALIYLQGQNNTSGVENPSLASPAASASPSPSATPDSGVNQNTVNPTDTPTPAATGSPTANKEQHVSNPNPDLTIDANGLSKAIVVLESTQGVIKYKFYSNDAPGTVKRMIELINQGFYNGLSFHRVVPDFVIQGGDPLGNGMGGSGQKLKAEFNPRRHVEGAVAMARAQDPNSADSQFYIALGVLPHLDRNYTVFGQVIEGMDAVRKIKVGDKMTRVYIE